MTEIKRPLKVFLYHAPADKIAVRDLYLRLINDGVDAWVVKERLLPGQDWKEELRNAFREADVVIICISERFHQGDFRHKEVRLALDTVLEQLKDEIFVIPASLEECDRLENLKSWQWVDLFKKVGYDVLLYALHVRANKIGATIEFRDGSLPHIHRPNMTSAKPVLENPIGAVQATPGTLIQETGILIEGPAEKLQPETSRRKLRRAMILALFILTGIMVIRAVGQVRIERWVQLVFTPGLETTPTSTPKTEDTPVAIPQVRPIPTLVGQGDISHIVFLIDASGSMEGQRIRMVKSAVSSFVSRLGDDHVISVIEFDTNVELRMASTRDRAAASEAIQSITVEVPHNGACIQDALYAGFQQASLPATETGTETMVILLTDVAVGENVGWDCGLRFMSDFFNFAWNHPVPIFSIYVGDRIAENQFVAWPAGEGAIRTANDERKIERTLISIAEAAGLEFNPVLPAPAETTDGGHVSMLFVPPGEFMMGTNTVYLDSFWIDKTEVTNAMYARCVQAAACSVPRSNRSNTRDQYYGNTEFDDYPVIYVSWEDANNYCSWAGGRLPTEAEWEKAARGTDGRQFPWGDNDPSGVDNLLNYHAQDTTIVGLYPDGASPYGALDMAGNVSEWVADWLSLDAYSNPPDKNPLGPDAGEYRVWRGGSWANTSIDRMRTSSRTGNFPTDFSSGIGFRCARDAGP